MEGITTASPSKFSEDNELPLPSPRRSSRFFSSSSPPSLSGNSSKERPSSRLQGLFKRDKRQSHGRSSLSVDLKLATFGLLGGTPDGSLNETGRQRSPLKNSTKVAAPTNNPQPEVSKPKKNILRNLTIKLRAPLSPMSISSSLLSPRTPRSCKSDDVVAARESRRQAALRARGLLPPSPMSRDLSSQERSRDEFLPALPTPPASSSEPTPAMLVRQEWARENMASSEVAHLQRLQTFKFGGDSLSLKTVSSDELSSPLMTPSSSPIDKTTSPKPSSVLGLSLSGGLDWDPTLYEAPLGIPLPPSPSPSRIDVDTLEEQMSIRPWTIPLPDSPTAENHSFLGSCDPPSMLASLQVQISVVPSTPSRRNSEAQSIPLLDMASFGTSKHTSMPSLGSNTGSSMAYSTSVETVEQEPNQLEPLIVQDTLADSTDPLSSVCILDEPSVQASTTKDGASTVNVRKSVNPFKRVKTLYSAENKSARTSLLRRTTLFPALKSSAVADDQSDRRPSYNRSRSQSSGRLAVSPTMHNISTIVEKVAAIDDEESRRMSELAFL